MRGSKLVAVAIGAVGLTLAACSTAIKVDAETAGKVPKKAAVQRASAELAAGVTAPNETTKKLEDAVMKAAGKGEDDATPVALNMTITLYRIVDAGTRFIGGAFAGSNKLSVSVDVADAGNGATLGHYAIERSANPGGYGVFYDQVQATIDEAAKGVMEGLRQAGAGSK